MNKIFYTYGRAAKRILKRQQLHALDGLTTRAKSTRAISTTVTVTLRALSRYTLSVPFTLLCQVSRSQRRTALIKRIK